jgi:23S rRNA G2445 N2-methylase RlmL
MVGSATFTVETSIASRNIAPQRIATAAHILAFQPDVAPAV